MMEEVPQLGHLLTCLSPLSPSTWCTVWGPQSPDTLSGGRVPLVGPQCPPTSFQKAGGVGDPAARPGFSSGCRNPRKSGVKGVSEMGLRNVWMGPGGGEHLTLKRHRGWGRGPA